jgi:hypothetical protein
MNLRTARLDIVGVLAVILALTSATADAQTEGTFAVGPQYSRHYPVSSELEDSKSFGIAYTRLYTGNGWNPEVGFGWFRADLAPPLAGRLRVRPIMAGVGYHIVQGRFRLNLSAMAGPAFTRIRVNDEGRAAFSEALGIPVEGVGIKNAWAVKPGVRVGLDLARRLGIFVAADYEIVRPKLEIASEGSA